MTVKRTRFATVRRPDFLNAALLAMLTIFAIVDAGRAGDVGAGAGPLARLVGTAGNHVGFSPGGTVILTCGDAGMGLWDAKTFQPVAPPICKHTIVDCEFVKRGESIFLASCPPPGAKSVEYQFYVDGAKLEAPGPAVHIEWARWNTRPRPSADGRYVAVGESLGDPNGPFVEVRVVDAETGKRVFRHQFSNPVLAVYPSPDGGRLITVEFVDLEHSLTWLWDLKTGKPLMDPIVRNPWEMSEDITGCGQWPSVDLSPDGKFFVLAKDTGFTVYNASDGKPAFNGVAPLRHGLAFPDNTAEFTPDGASVVNIRDSVCVWKLATGQRSPQYLLGHDIFSHSISADGKRFAYAFREHGEPYSHIIHKGVGVMDLGTGKTLLMREQTGDDERTVVAISPDGTMLAASGKVDTLIFAVPTPAPAGR